MQRAGTLMLQRLRRLQLALVLRVIMLMPLHGLSRNSKMVTAKVWVVDKKINAFPELDNFKLITETLPTCGDGEFIVEAEWLTVDPYLRLMMDDLQLGTSPEAGQVARVTESRNERYPVGSRVVAYLGWRTHTLLNDDIMDSNTSAELLNRKLFPEVEGLPLSAALGVLGMPGNTAYFGFLEICNPKPGDVVVVNAAAGAVGSVVCQIAKIKGCTVIAFAGTDQKVSWLWDLGVDVAANYKTDDVKKVIKQAAPNGVNCYFDNVGGRFSAKVFPLLARRARVSVCGAVASYNNERQDEEYMSSPYSEALINHKELRVEGFLVNRWSDRWREGIQQLRKWIDEGKLKNTEAVTDGFENTPHAFIGLFRGDNVGKAVVKV
ncbi:Alcohol dehydrogenase C-terminal [Trinorchestia longiramus]|nr:Alcohol dehydrogenase C-terminal [Trinorchestia longiramus]